jgi:bifunctional oligoribonuclease and PAP phosphatase NrnA
MKELYEQFWKEVKQSQKILVIGHRKPDGDALGSMCAMKIWLETLGKDIKLACVDKASKRYRFLPHVDEIEKDINPLDHDIVLILDCGARYMTDFHVDHPEIVAKGGLSGNGPLIVNIDHHASNDNFGHINIVDDKSASATMIIYDIFKYLDVEITSDIATCLITGLYNDTGSFMHSNTSGEVYAVASELLSKGAKISPIIKSLFRSNSIPALRLWGKAFLNARVTDDNFILSVMRKGDVCSDSENGEQLSGAVDYLNMVPDVDFALLVREEGKNVKGSFRTRRDDVDLSEIAKRFGGGGHPKAAGFSVPGKIKEEVHYRIDSDELESQPLNL